jgi:hypothetical protein
MPIFIITYVDYSKSYRYVFLKMVRVMKTKHILIIVLTCLITGTCEKTSGPEGKKSLIKLVEELPGSNCIAGGIKIISGIDNNANDILDEVEYQVSEYICNGNNGLNSVTSVLEEKPGIFCNSGGYKINSGIDLNNNGLLDSIEVQNTEYVCNGDFGFNSLLSITQLEEGIICNEGGVKISSGIDLNNNNVLDSIEVQNIEYVCNGNPGFNSLYSITGLGAGSICNAGGLIINWGLDLNNNSILDSIEISKTENICNGNNGSNSLITTETEPSGANCSAGGYKISSGLDLNNNNILDTIEIQSIEYICHGVDGKLDRQIRFDFNTGGVSYYFENQSFMVIEYSKILNFDLNNYPDVDSISFCAYLHAEYSGPYSIVEMYNYTDGKSIQNSEIRSNSTVRQLVSTNSNLINYIPAKPIILGLRGRTSVNGQAVFMDNPLLILYRKNP